MKVAALLELLANVPATADVLGPDGRPVQAHTVEFGSGRAFVMVTPEDQPAPSQEQPER